MKKIKILQLLIVSVCIAAFRPVAEPFEGTIRYETHVTGDVPRPVTERLAKYYEFKFKGTDIKVIGGAPLRGEILLKKGYEKMFIIRSDQKNIYEVDFKDERIPETSSKPVVTPMNESVTVAGYSCQRFNVKYDNGTEVYVWATSGITISPWGTAQIFRGHFDLPKEIIGMPLRIQIVSKHYTLTATATVVKAVSMDPSEFNVPDGMSIRKL